MLAGIRPVKLFVSRSKAVREVNDPNFGAIWPLSLPQVNDILVMLQDDDAHSHSSPIQCLEGDDDASQGSLTYPPLLSRVKFQAIPVKFEAYIPNFA